MTPLKAIRAHCLECANTAPEVRLCSLTKCPLHPFRFGSNPWKPQRVLSAEERAAIGARLTAARGRAIAVAVSQRRESPAQAQPNAGNGRDGAR